MRFSSLLEKDKAEKIAFFLISVWVLLFVLDYFLQFFRGHMWAEHALPILNKFK